ncbi:hypothetical protein Ancab_000271 [Ancistrocladus abbreviatus]
MGSTSNWLGFSLSPQELPSQTHHSQNTVVSHRLGFISDEIPVGTRDVSAGDGFDLPSDTTRSINPFGILEAFNRDNQSQEHWGMKAALGMSYKPTNTEQYLLMGSSFTSGGQEPKLENFLDIHNNGGDYMFTTTVDATTNPSSSSDNTNSGNNGINVSMIKTWLRKHPSQTENKDDGGGDPGCGSLTNPQTLSLSMMSAGSESATSAVPFLTANSKSVNGDGSGGSGGDKEDTSSDNNKNINNNNNNNSLSNNSSRILDAQSGAIEAIPGKSIDTFGQRTSIYRGVTRHRWTGRYEAHLWDNSCRREGQTRKGRQGGYDKEEKAARAYDLAAIKYWGTTTTTNFPISNYEKETEEMKHMTRQEYVASLRRKSSGFSRGASIYRGVTRHHQHGRWQARIGRVAGNKDLYLGTFTTQEEAAEAYDIAAIKFRGLNAVTNFEISRYDVKAILESSTLPIGGAAKRLKRVEDLATDGQRSIEDSTTTSQLTDRISNYHGWPTIAFRQAQPVSMYHPYAQHQMLWCKQEHDSDSFQDLHQLQLGNTHNFFQPNSVVHNLMSLDGSSMEHSSGSNSVIYGGGGGESANGGGSYQGVGYGTNGGFLMPMTTVVGHEKNGYGDNSDAFGSSTDAYHARNMHYMSQQQNDGVVKAGAYDNGSTCNNWIPTAVPTLAAARGNNMAVCHGAPSFTVWNNT